MHWVDLAIVGLFFLGMLAFGLWLKDRLGILTFPDFLGPIVIGLGLSAVTLVVGTWLTPPPSGLVALPTQEAG